MLRYWHMNDFRFYLLTVQVIVLLISYLTSRKSVSAQLTKILGWLTVVSIAGAMVLTALSTKNLADGLLLLTYGIWLLSLSRLIESQQTLVYVKMTVLRDSK